MTNHLNNALPFKILKMIFENLAEEMWWAKSSIKACSSVCKSWKLAAQEFREISIKVSEDSLERLSRDIVYFSHRVKSICLRENMSTTTSVNRSVTCLVWFGVILACPNLTSIDIRVRDDSNYVQCLMDIAVERFAHIQKFTTSTSKLHLQLNLKYCKTITSLRIDSTENNTCGKVSNNTLVKFVLHFPKLTYLSIQTPNIDTTTDIIQLLEVAPQLQNLFVYHFNEIKKSNSTIFSENSCLTSLCFAVKKMDIDSLIIIATRLTNLHRLVLDIDSLITESFGIREKYNSAEELLDILKHFTSGISQFRITYEYENVTYILENATIDRDDYSLVITKDIPTNIHRFYSNYEPVEYLILTSIIDKTALK